VVRPQVQVVWQQAAEQLGQVAHFIHHAVNVQRQEKVSKYKNRAEAYRR